MTQTAEWAGNPHALHADPLLDCLSELTRIYGRPSSPQALAAGLPLVNNKLTPSLLPRAAARAGLAARLVRKNLDELNYRSLPALLVLDDQQACLLLEWLPDGRARVRWSDAGESSDIVSAETLALQYTGVAVFVRPRFRFEARAPELGKVRAKHWFWSVVFGNWRIYRDALLAALLINLFALTLPLFSMNVYDRVVPNHAQETLWVLAIGALLVMSFDFGMRTVRSHIIDVASKRIDITLSALIMERVLGIKMANRPQSVGSFAANLRSFESVRDFIASASITAVIDLPFVFLFLLVLIWLSPWLLLPPLAGMFLVVLFSLVTQGKMHELVEATQRATAQRNATLVESVAGIETVKALEASSGFQRKWEESTLYIAQMGTKIKLLSSSTVNFANTAAQWVNVVTVITGVYLLIDKELSMGGIIAASMLSGRIMAPFGQVAGLMMQFQNARTALNGIESYMNLPVERPEGSNFLHREHFSGAIEFKHVSFSYGGQPVLKDVSFRINPGERVGVIGRIGSGKSTLEKLILGLYQPEEGAVLIDGVDTRQIDPADLRRAIGYVPQDPILFYGSLRENIVIGAPHADDAMVLAAADNAGVNEFADVHPHGFDMMIGERGESLSGGQRQTVAIARALLNDPAMLLLDEPTSSMDHMSEERLKGRMRALIPGKTLLLVTHRTSMLDLVDRLIVVDDGAIVADGPKAVVVEALQQGRVGRRS
ncbi:ATP-binding cassette, subfamily C, LapB [Andreprevotia lacus DSM 23236]|uniref:Cyclolysin secretion/processing ATP-binding protein CyaB n=1 Tax=Andreprevotia lacus DSM 23236 TaxID=1121001 RepID=A0A1W1XD99_9NEIS|nr:type I secretion system permease/ATPase [Andreprevotia lacus]SMC21471.1 ATP-binding cassette, subfamily C, LapB [Andreprevotia lacus DSM 23236]